MRLFGLPKLSLLVVSLCFAAAASADQRWTLTTADFQRKVVELSEINAESVVISAAEKVTIPVGRVLRLDRGTLTGVDKSTYQLTLQNGDVIPGSPADMRDEILHWQNPTLGLLKLPLSGLRSIVRKDKSRRSPAESNEDQILLNNKDLVRGAVTGIENSSVNIQSNGDTSAVPLSGIDAIYFAAAKKQVTKNRFWKIILTDGSVLSPEIIFTDGQALVFDLRNGLPVGPKPAEKAAGSALKVPLEKVISIEQFNGPISWLSDREPSKNIHTPFSSETILAAKMNLNVFGKPIRFGSDTFEKGIGVHANSVLTFPLDGTYKVFQTRYAIDSGADTSKAVVQVQILLDGKVVHEAKNIRGFKMSPVVAIDLNNAKELTLQVTAAGMTDAQDRLNWIDCALVKEKIVVPASAPSTQPALK